MFQHRFSASFLTVALSAAWMCLAFAPTVNGEEAAEIAPATGREIILFDGKTLKNWEETDFGGQGEAHVEEGILLIDQGEPLSGINWSGEKLPNVNYEITLEAKRVDGNDFFCAITFPVVENPCTLVLGGWGGSLIGLSNVNDFDASENDTTDYYSFENGKWYKIRLRVDDEMIRAWIDGEQVVKLNHKENRISVRIEMELSKPLGLATFQTTGAIRNFTMRELQPKAAGAKASPETKSEN
ncbi:DUF1080 domain-containing protein [Thalassoglobus sp. JC818]|uniref:3-keto-disaccharide hydrolase n=1 Tax=Thalassoglobus sp. JC818 TaxID=3232136 RepID=UPI0034586751